MSKIGNLLAVEMLEIEPHAVGGGKDILPFPGIGYAGKPLFYSGITRAENENLKYKGR
jgi:hypothetical protein